MNLFRSLVLIFFARLLAACGEGFTSADPTATIAPPIDASSATSECLYPSCEGESLCQAPSVESDPPRAVGDLSADALRTLRATSSQVRFVAQPPAALAMFANSPWCTANLISDRHVLLAGHCFTVPSRRVAAGVTVTPELLCNAFEFAFGLWRTGGASGPTAVPDVYRCQQVAELNKTLDFAIVTLDRPVTGVTPLRLAQHNPTVGTSIAIAHYPGGRTQQISTGTITSVSGTRCMHRGSTEGGSSGASVCDARTLEVLCLHVAGGCTTNSATSANRAVPVETLLAASPMLRMIAAAPAVTTCAMGSTRCGTACVDTMTDTSNCGACGVTCTSGTPNTTAGTCMSGMCRSSCSAGFGDCDGNAANGCETSLLSAAAHCGACGRACALRNVSTNICAAGTCTVGVCAPGFSNCDGIDANGCEVLTRGGYDDSNCGACGRSCSTGTHCYGGSCVRADVLCGGVVPCGAGGGCAQGMACVGSGDSQRCVCEGVTLACDTGLPSASIARSYCVPSSR